MTPPARQIRASYDDTTITVYQAYSPSIARPALAAGTFVAPFNMQRMTWIKPSFTWMMYRSGWGTKPGQERVLAIRMRREGFDAALAQGCLSHYDAGVHHDYEAWEGWKHSSCVRIQWDPERSRTLAELPWRTIQVGLTGKAVADYVATWIVAIEDVTALAHRLHREHAATPDGFPEERPYPVADDVAARLGMTVDLEDEPVAS